MKKKNLKTKNNTHGGQTRTIIPLSAKLAMIFFSLVAIIGFCVFAGIYLSGRRIIKDNATSAYLVGLQYSAQVLDESLSSVEYSTFPMLIDSQMKEYLQAYPSSSVYQKYSADQYFLSQMKNIVIQNKYIESAYLYNVNQGTLIGTNLSHTYYSDELAHTGWKEILTDKYSYTLGQWVTVPSLSSESKILVSNFKRILGQNNKELGIIVINMYPEFWTETTGNRNNGDFVLMSIDPYGTTLQMPGEGEPEYQPPLPIGSASDGYFTDGDYTITYVHSKYSGWCYMGVAKTDDMLDGMVSFRNTVFIATIVIIFASSIALLLITAHVMHPINVLKTSMEKVGTGDFSYHISEERNDDFQILYNGYNSMVMNLESTVQTVYRQQLEKKDLSMQILRSQIDAHFLYNTLDAVHWISVLHDDSEVSEIVMHLASYYRIMLNQGRDLLTLKACVELITNYLDILQIKNGYDLLFKAEIPEKYMGAYVLKNIFQPIIENSIQHGMNGNTTPLEITLRCVPDSEKGILQLIVEDNGRGITPERLAEIEKKLAGEECSELDGSFALKNISSQIKTYYGDEYELRIESVPQRYTRVYMTAAIIWQEDEENV